MARKTPTPSEPQMVTLRRLDALGGTITLDADHAARLLALEAQLNLCNYAQDDAAGADDDTAAMEG